MQIYPVRRDLVNHNRDDRQTVIDCDYQNLVKLMIYSKIASNLSNSWMLEFLPKTDIPSEPQITAQPSISNSVRGACHVVKKLSGHRSSEPKIITIVHSNQITSIMALIMDLREPAILDCGKISRSCYLYSR